LKEPEDAPILEHLCRQQPEYQTKQRFIVGLVARTAPMGASAILQRTPQHAVEFCADLCLQCGNEARVHPVKSSGTDGFANVFGSQNRAGTPLGFDSTEESLHRRGRDPPARRLRSSVIPADSPRHDAIILNLDGERRA